MPSIHRREAEFVRERIYVDSAGWRPSEEAVPYLPALWEAIWLERKVGLVYRRADGDGQAERVADPLGVVAKGKVWYLVAAAGDDLRTYRVSRLLEVRILDQPSVRPVGFNLEAYWTKSSAEFIANLPRYPATVRVAPGTLERLRRAWRYARVERIDAPDADGWTKLGVLFEVEEEASENVLALGPDIEVLEPEALRAKVAELALGTAALYSRHRPHSAPAPAASTPAR